MPVTEIDLEKAALLHDIGKLYQRAGKIRKSHSVVGQEILAHFFDANHQAILRAVACHHQNELQTNHLPDDDISYIVYEADNLAAASDRRTLMPEGAQTGKGMNFVSDLPLGSIFNIFNRKGDTDQSAYRLEGIEESKGWPYPDNRNEIAAPSTSYEKLATALTDIFKKRSPQDMTLSELLQALEKTLSYVPSSTNTAEAADISLYDHQKLTAAFAVCLWHVFQERGITDYKSYCYGKKQKTLRTAPAYRLASGDISGIQKFIYTIPSKGALKSLRGRSLYLDILLEHIVDEILEACHVSRSCLLYTGGGHFYLLLPNTAHTQEVLRKADTAINGWFLRHYGTNLYIALASVSCSAADFSVHGGGAGKVFQKVSQALRRKKLCRYNQEQLTALFDAHSVYNENTDGSRECAICHTASSAADLRPYGDDTDEGAEEACKACNALFQLGKSSLTASVFAISASAGRQGVPLPGLSQDYYLQAIREENLAMMDRPKRIYVKNELTLGQAVSTHLWMGDYVTCNEQGHAVEFTELAQQSGGSRENTGIARIGVLRCDVDNLGAAFIAGFSPEYDTLSRKVTLSRNLSLFFKQYIKTLCQGHTASGVSEFTLFADEIKKERKIHVIYSGGDDMFLAGTWDDILEAAVDIRHAFRRFTNGKLTFSAGIGFFHPSCPIAQMARKTGDLEDYAKANPHHDKDSLALFGEVSQPAGKGSVVMTARYSWDDFEQGVCQEKLRFLERKLTLQKENPSKLFVGKTALYRLLDLLRQAEADSSHIQLARFAYTLARMEPKQRDSGKWRCYQALRTTLYDWYQSTADRQQLMTAIELLIYHVRDKE